LYLRNLWLQVRMIASEGIGVLKEGGNSLKFEMRNLKMSDDGCQFRIFGNGFSTPPWTLEVTLRIESKKRGSGGLEGRKKSQEG